MSTTESLNSASSASSRAGVSYSQSHTQTHFSRLRPRPRTRPSHHNTIQPKTTTGWLFASGSSWTLRAHRWVQAGHPRYTGARKGRPWKAHDRRPSDTDMPRTNVLSGKQVQTDVLSARTGVDRHFYTYMVVELARRSHGDREMKQSTRCRLVNRFEVEASRIVKKIVQRNGTIIHWRRSIRSPGTQPSTSRSAESVHGQNC